MSSAYFWFVELAAMGRLTTRLKMSDMEALKDAFGQVLTAKLATIEAVVSERNLKSVVTHEMIGTPSIEADVA